MLEPMKTFRFPNVCACCGVDYPEHDWPICREEAFGTRKTTYAISVPVCAVCHAALLKRDRLAILVAGLVGLTVLVGLWGTCSAWGVGGLIAVVVLGLCATATVLLGLERVVGLRFARIGSSGSTLYFSNPEFQRAFDDVNLTSRDR